MCDFCPQKTPRCCCIFYAIWCIGNGILCAISYAPCIVWYARAQKIMNEENISTSWAWRPGTWAVLWGIYLAISLSYLIAGILLAVGMIKPLPKYRLMFRIGKIMSYIYPIAHTLLIYPMIVHFCCVMRLSDYIKERWEK